MLAGLSEYPGTYGLPDAVGLQSHSVLCSSQAQQGQQTESCGKEGQMFSKAIFWGPDSL